MEGQRRMRAPFVGAAVAALATGLVAVPAAGSDSDSGSGSDAIPVADTVTWHEGQDDERVRVSGAVHAVRRVEGGTAVYYSLGVPEGAQAPSNYNRVLPGKQLGSDYGVFDAYAVTVVDTEGLQGYQPMVGADGCLCPEITQFGAEAGELNVAWALLPELPADVDVVDVTLAYGATVAGVPVGEGPLEPTTAGTGGDLPVLGEGWPELPDVASAGVDNPSAFVVDLVRRSSDLEREVVVSEQPDQVEVAIAADVLFAVDSSTLSPQAQGRIDEVAADIAERGTGEVLVVGHTDDTGDNAYNGNLSQARAQSVLAALQGRVGDAVTLTAEGRGEEEPVADNATEEGRQLNRRVTITYAVDPEAAP